MQSDAAAEGTHFSTAWRLALGGWLGCVLLQLFLYLRPSPYGGPFLLEWRKYFLHALYYDLMGVWLLAFPFLFFWLVFGRRTPTRPAPQAVHLLQALVLAANLALSQLDHEVLRFLGIRLGISFLATYGQPQTLGDSLFADVLRADHGGPFIGLLLLVVVPGLYLWWATALIRRRRQRPREGARLWLALLILIVPLAAPANAWQKATAQFRLRKTEPVTFAIAGDLALRLRSAAPRDIDRLVRDYRARWLAESADKGWRFRDAAYPYLRVPERASEPPPGVARWNLIYIQLETLRGHDVGYLGGRRPSATPFLDSLARDRRAAAFTRALSFGPPSINGLFAGHCSVPPHSLRYMTGFTHADFYCLPEMLRRRGYRAEMFNAGDTDWDNGTFWLARWYDRLWRYPQADEHDRPVFRAAAKRIRELGGEDRPFMATVVSVSNHTPFISKERAFDIAGTATPQERIRNTTRYTDDVVREFVETLRREPWFERTLIVIIGDHGFNMGEHDRRPGQQNLYRESLWIPLILYGDHPRLPRGARTQLASLLDLPPTLADLLGIREANPWQGHSLLEARPASFAVGNRDMVAAEAGPWSLVIDPLTGGNRLFDSRGDWGQARDLASARPRTAAALAERARASVRLNDHLLGEGRIAPRRGRGEASAVGAAAKRPIVPAPKRFPERKGG